MDTNTAEALDEPNLYAGSDDEPHAGIDGDDSDRGDSVEEAPEPVTAKKEPEPEAETEITAEDEALAKPDSEEDEAVEAEPEQKTDYRIPKSRLDDEIAKRRALEAKLADIEEREQQAKKGQEKPSFDFEVKETEYMNAVLDGETELAARIRSEIRQAERESYETEFSNRMDQTKSQTRQELELEQTAKEVARDYPIFDNQSDSFDNDLTSEVVLLRDTFMQQGYGVSDALRKAARMVVASSRPELMVDRASADKVPPVQKTAKRDLSSKVDAANRQPPDVQKAARARSNADTGYAVEDLTEQDFEALPESKLAELRGDIV